MPYIQQALRGLQKLHFWRILPSRSEVWSATGDRCHRWRRCLRSSSPCLRFMGFIIQMGRFIWFTLLSLSNGFEVIGTLLKIIHILDSARRSLASFLQIVNKSNFLIANCTWKLIASPKKITRLLFTHSTYQHDPYHYNVDLLPNRRQRHHYVRSKFSNLAIFESLYLTSKVARGGKSNTLYPK